MTASPVEQDVYLLRHGALDPQARHCFVGQIDLALSSEGLAQGQKLARHFAHVPLDALYCSDLARSRQTAELIAAAHGGLELRVRPALREIALGAWDGKKRAQVALDDPQRYAARGRDILHVRPPGGESFADCLARVLPVWEDILSSSARVAIVAHAGINRLLLSHALGMPMPLLLDIAQDYGCLNRLHRLGGQWQALAINRLPP
ncbi:MAG: histidine phosphatase family protein [Paludibacterium sp.]|uniref:histidine phosphatase family protein n=1 Tax=Paludibacterium sp. TaxID=1917523 RepID=UPI0025E2F27D|nr:histidine phosphatase family protein [Paludibacterium sp.]MBV8047197.1 histidine phosphatase family protein [Paludibacterium sp.]MBV8646093.1 histidine phosphatase family protein [Paludibacterium sp.]